MGNNPRVTVTDCREEDGVTVGLIDSLIAIARVLARREFSSVPVQEALKDLASDEDMARVMRQAEEAAKA